MELQTKLLNSYEVLSNSFHCENILNTYQAAITYSAGFFFNQDELTLNLP